MSKFLGVLSFLVVLLMALGFAAANAGHRVTIDLGLFTLYQVPVTLVAFSGLFLGMVTMFLTGVHTDLKVRKILRDRFALESRQERIAIDKNQQDLFGASETPLDPRPEGRVKDPGTALEEAEPEAPASEVDKPSSLQQTE
jgi:hypothetical protein